MATKTTKNTSATANTEVPTIYADQPAKLAFGPYITKITLGLVEDDGGEYPTPAITIAMPTVNLMRMVADLNQLFESSDFKSNNLKALTEDASRYFGATKVPQDDPARRSTVKRISRRSES